MTTALLDDRQVRRIAFGNRLSHWDFKLSPYLYVSPFFILFALTGLFPILYTAYVSVYDWHIIGGQGDFVGLGNFEWVLGQEKFWLALRNSFSIFLLSAIPQVIFALIIAAVLSDNLRAKTFWRMGVLVPYVVAPVAVALIFSNMFGDQYGLINNLLGRIGLDPVGWHSQVVPSHLAIATMVNFRWTGYNALIFLAAMQAIPRDYYEAAMLDGATKLRQFFSITIPSLRPTLIFVIITSTIGGLQIFDEPRMYDQSGQGGASAQWLTITMFIYNQGFGQTGGGQFGHAAAAAWLLFIIIIVVGLINLAATRAIASAGTRNGK
ncbi:cellobiose transport system permease protein [Conyzicola lurida]|jgi:cellobiose transport system permease protein|uniref:Cellobiose transport system permease protein n=1 Tax=Conyzicola lurida TaxID=1172621 RepID=A0A841AR25_9MICO|nr:sugar ABC transporter permease [Conyzicola lurida]MBB5844734.1 cellobiose transport system permease protein [Conyzicola lurida]